MPPKAKLPDAEIAILEQWVREGAPDPRSSSAAGEKKRIDLEAGRRFWAFQPVSNPLIPDVRDATWPLDPLDRFLLSRMEAAGIRPAGDAKRLAWLRRVSLDLTGLPPSVEAVRAFESDTSAQAHEKVVDQLLASKAYGERWARHWLDLTGYADMMGTSNSVYAEHAWRYRDWLINALNADLPFDQFVREQIAGDLMPAESVEDRAAKITATGFLMVGDIEIVNPDKAKMEADHIDTQVIKIGQTFLGMTLGCARCHDHKFDPVGLEDYYAIAGILRSAPSSKKIDFGVWSSLRTTNLPETPVQLAERQKLERQAEEHIVALKARQKTLKSEKETVLKELSNLGGTPPSPPTAAAGGTTSDAPRESARASEVQPEPPKAAAERGTLEKRSNDLESELKKLVTQIQHAEFFKDRTPKAFAMQDGEKPADMPVYIRGNPYATASIVSRGALRVASWEAFPPIPPGQSGRLQLAHWLADPRNPLTARVAVNRMWQKLFGTGLVPSIDYFGTRGELPTHPELLDHLASRFMKAGWSRKAFLRSLVLSRAYRLSSANDPEAAQVDPENKLLWRMNRQRLDAEALRDSLLAVSGELTREGGGPALVLENPANCGPFVRTGVNPPSYGHREPRAAEEFERTIYLPVFRNGYTQQDKLRAAFDFINPAMIGGLRNETIVPTQALFLLNNGLLRKRASVLATQMLAETKDDAARLERLWLRVLSRPITPPEQEEALKFLEESRASGDSKKTISVLWTELTHSLLASNEFLFRL
jgi:hypothetical protein